MKHTAQDFFVQPAESPPTGQMEECNFKALSLWFHFSELEVAAWPTTRGKLLFLFERPEGTQLSHEVKFHLQLINSLQ